MKCTLYAAFFGLAMLLGQSSVTAQDAEELTQSTTTPDGIRANVAHWERELETELKLFNRGFSSEARVDRIRAWLAKAAHDLAAHENDLEGVAEQRRQLLGVRERQWKRLRGLRELGHSSELQVTEAQRRLAVNRYLLATVEERQAAALEELKRTVELCGKEVELLEKAAAKKLVIRSELNVARNRLVCAKYQLLKANARPEEQIGQLREAVEMLQQDWTIVKQLSERRSSTIFDEYYAHVYLLDAKLRLASAEGEPAALADVLRELVRLHEDILEKGRTAGWGAYYTHSDKKAIETSIAMVLTRDTQRLEFFQQTGLLRDDLTVAELDP